MSAQTEAKNSNLTFLSTENLELAGLETTFQKVLSEDGEKFDLYRTSDSLWVTHSVLKSGHVRFNTSGNEMSNGLVRLYLMDETFGDGEWDVSATVASTHQSNFPSLKEYFEAYRSDLEEAEKRTAWLLAVVEHAKG